MHIFPEKNPSSISLSSFCPIFLVVNAPSASWTLAGCAGGFCRGASHFSRYCWNDRSKPLTAETPFPPSAIPAFPRVTLRGRAMSRLQFSFADFAHDLLSVLDEAWRDGAAVSSVPFSKFLPGYCRSGALDSSGSGDNSRDLPAAPQTELLTPTYLHDCSAATGRLAWSIRFCSILRDQQPSWAQASFRLPTVVLDAQRRCGFPCDD